MSSDSYTVPVLSLSNSRSRKNIPTKDAYQPRNYGFQTKNIQLTSNPYLQKREQIRTNYITESRVTSNYMNLPPKPRVSQGLPPNIPKREVKQITRNVYLRSQQEQFNNNMNYVQPRQQGQLGTTSNIAIERARQILTQSNSRGSLFRNPESRVQIQNQVKKQTDNMQFKKLDINKALFDRKLSKLLQQIQIYDEELNGLYNDSLTDQLQELQKIKDQSKKAHSKIMKDLNALIV